MINGLDILVAAKIYAVRPNKLSFAELGKSIGVSASQVHRAFGNCVDAGLLRSDGSVRTHQLKLVLMGLKYFMPPKFGPVSRGILTGSSVAAIHGMLVREDLPLIWESADGDVRGRTLEPIYKSAPFAAKNDPLLHKILGLTDSVRVGEAREARLARNELRALIRNKEMP